MPAGWSVVSQRHNERYMESGQFVPVVEVGIRADDGTHKTLIVPEAQYTASNVLALGDQWLAQHDAILALNHL